MNGIFLSYRRDDTAGEARHLFAELKLRFPAHSVYMDVNDVRVGFDFRKEIDERISDCAVMLVLIGKDWLLKTAGQPRLFESDDMVRHEIRLALRNKRIHVVPVLVQSAIIPDPSQLPEDISDLAYRHAFDLRHNGWDFDVETLANALQPHLPAPQVHNRSRLVEFITTPTKARFYLFSALAGAALLLALAGFGADILREWHLSNRFDNGDIKANLVALNELNMTERSEDVTAASQRWMVAKHNSGEIVTSMVRYANELNDCVASGTCNADRICLKVWDEVDNVLALFDWYISNSLEAHMPTTVSGARTFRTCRCPAMAKKKYCERFKIPEWCSYPEGCPAR